MKTIIEQKASSGLLSAPDTPRASDRRVPPHTRPRVGLMPFAFLGGMVLAILLVDAVLPLRGFWFHDATLTQMGIWPILPSLLLFPSWKIIPPIPSEHIFGTPQLFHSWGEFPLLVGVFVIVFLVYLFAVQRLPGRISWRFLFRSTLLLGILFALIPIVTSPDLYSYIAYARIGVLYGLNPLTTLPTAIRTDPIYSFVLWVDQPSAYGPTWAIITTMMQWTLVHLGNTYVLPMVLALRSLGLAAHLASVGLIWSISGKFQQLKGHSAPFPSRRRVRATLAFAWNPLLLLEACTNAHNDAVLLVFLLLAIWVLAQSKLQGTLVETSRGVGLPRPQLGVGLPRPQLGVGLPRPQSAGDIRQGRGKPTPLHGFSSRSLRPLRYLRMTHEALVQRPMQRMVTRIPADLRAPIAASALLALATCLKINLVLLFPALLFYFWIQAPRARRWKHAAAATLSYVGVIVLSYAPFWEGGAIFNVFRVNPATYRTANTVTDFLAHFYNGIAGMLGYSPGAPIGSPAERFLHTFSMGIFALLYLLMLWRMIRAPKRMSSLLHGPVYWMALTWLLYCAIGSPWFWSWYLVTFFGLFALIEAGGELDERDTHYSASETALFPWSFRLLRSPWLARLLTFSMLSLYCFATWGPSHSFVPGLPGFLWSYFGGLWEWGLPFAGAALLALQMRARKGDPSSTSI